jgi:NitT/TauT family transport system ATP-binding protein
MPRFTDQGHTPHGRVLEVNGLRVVYEQPTGPKPVLDGIGFAVEAGEFLCIVGPSGVGKTTLMRCLAGLMRPTGGAVTLEGAPVVSPPVGLSVVFQDYSRSLFPWMKVLTNVALPLRAAGASRAQAAEKAHGMLEAVGLHNAGAQYPWQLSGGMQQRVAIARALVSAPDVLLMDEPFASVDAQTRMDLEDLSLAICARTGVSVVLVTHDIDEAVYLADRVLVLSGSPAAVSDVVTVALPAPRDQLTTRAAPEFAALRTRILAKVRSGSRVSQAGFAAQVASRTQPVLTEA